MTDVAEPSKVKAKLTLFFVLTFIISIPFYILAALLPQETVLFVGLTLTISPITSALILNYREYGSEYFFLHDRIRKRRIDDKYRCEFQGIRIMRPQNNGFTAHKFL